MAFWMYHETEGERLFNDGEVPPAGWVDSPAKFGQKPAAKAEEPKAPAKTK